MAFLYGRTGRLTAKNGGFRPGQVADCQLGDHGPPTFNRFACSDGSPCADGSSRNANGVTCDALETPCQPTGNTLSPSLIYLLTFLPSCGDPANIQPTN